MKLALCAALGLMLCQALASSATTSAEETPGPTILLMTGAAGEVQYEKEFGEWTSRWHVLASTARAKLIAIGSAHAGDAPDALRGLASSPDEDADDRELLRASLANERSEGPDLWLVLIGHGTFDGREARFNCRGPDFSASELAEWLKPLRGRQIILVNCSSASSPFIPAISGPNRVVITATRSGHEQNYSRFGGYFAEAIGSPDADLDKDGQTSLLEAFLLASRRTSEFYTAAGRLASEHALLDDNGDGQGTEASWFRGVRVVKRAAEGGVPDGLRAHQIHLVRSAEEQALPEGVRKQRDVLELKLSQLREQKSGISDEEYYSRLEKLLVELARLYERAPAPEATASSGSAADE